MVFRLAPPIQRIFKKILTGIQVVGPLPTGLPPFTGGIVGVEGAGWVRVLQTSISVALASLVESLAIGRALSQARGHTLDPSQEMRALGLANLVGSCWGSYGTAGSFSRSSVK